MEKACWQNTICFKDAMDRRLFKAVWGVARAPAAERQQNGVCRAGKGWREPAPDRAGASLEALPTV